MALTKSVALVDEWVEVAQNAVREGATTDVSGNYSSALHIDIALSSATAHTGSKIEVQVSSNTSGDEDWSTLTEFIGPTGTPNGEQIDDDPLAASSTTITVTDTTGLWDDDETRWIFIEDGTVANSELCLLVSHVANTSITIQDGTTNAHALDTWMWDVADTYTIDIPIWANRVRVIYDNTYDSDGATIHTKCRISKVTGI
ncbi:MAG: hypothetical protein ACFFDT_37035 [Candidatus Hodarchaeota archaeon]